MACKNGVCKRENKPGLHTCEIAEQKAYAKGYETGFSSGSDIASELYEMEINHYRLLQPFFVFLGGIVTIITFDICSLLK